MKRRILQIRDVCVIRRKCDMARDKYQEKKRKTKKYGRFAVVLVVLIVVVLGVVFGLSSCSKTNYDSESSFKAFSKSYWKSLDGKQKSVDGKDTIDYGEPLSIGVKAPKTGLTSADNLLDEVSIQMRDNFDEDYSGLMREEKTALMSNYESYESDALLGIAIHKDVMSENEDKKMAPTVSKVYTFSFNAEKGTQVSNAVLLKDGYKKSAAKYIRKELKSEHSDLLLSEWKTYVNDEQENLNNFVLTGNGARFFFDGDTVMPAGESAAYIDVPGDVIDKYINKDIGKRALDPNKPMIALTYDDGPEGPLEDRLLDCLEENDAVATFFLLGANVDNVEGSDEILKRMLKLNCEIGSHAYDHPNLFTLSDAKIKDQADKTAEAIKNASGKYPTIFRPPYGNGNEKTAKIFNLPQVLWSVDTLDWKYRNAGTIADNLMNTKNLDGKVILLHSIHKTSVEASETFIPYFKAQGYQFATVSELMMYKYNETPVKGKAYDYNYFYLDDEDETVEEIRY